MCVWCLFLDTSRLLYSCLVASQCLLLVEGTGTFNLKNINVVLMLLVLLAVQCSIVLGSYGCHGQCGMHPIGRPSVAKALAQSGHSRARSQTDTRTRDRAVVNIYGAEHRASTEHLCGDVLSCSGTLCLLSKKCQTNSTNFTAPQLRQESFGCHRISTSTAHTGLEINAANY